MSDLVRRTAPDAPSLILASTSTGRRAILDGVGLTFETMAPGVDEDEVKLSMGAEKAPAAAVAEALAELKAVRVSQRRPEALVIGADQVLACDGALFDKPRDLAEARSHLRRLRGKTHELATAVAVAKGGGRIWHHNAVARLTVRPFSDRFLDEYVERCGETLTTSVGAYRIEGPGPQLFSRIEGDYFTILGLPLLPLLDFLRGHDVVKY